MIIYVRLSIGVSHYLYSILVLLFLVISIVGVGIEVGLYTWLMCEGGTTYCVSLVLLCRR